MVDLISVIVTTYNREDALDTVLRSLARQTDRNFEVTVADDGSGPATAALVRNWIARFGVPLRHVWQEDKGFRAAEIRNRAILASRGDYCVFLDGDCLARPDFLAVHRRLAEPGWLVTGNRILLSPVLTENVLQNRITPETWSLGAWIGQRMTGGINRLAPVLRLPLGPLRKARSSKWRGARSCNLAIWRSDLDRVDGYDADYSGWGKEDSDLLIRLLRTGVRRKDGAFAAGVLHLWHSEADRSRLAGNERRLDDILARDDVLARSGLAALRAGALEAKGSSWAVR